MAELLPEIYNPRSILERPESFIFEATHTGIGNRIYVLLREVGSGKVKRRKSWFKSLVDTLDTLRI